MACVIFRETHVVGSESHLCIQLAKSVQSDSWVCRIRAALVVSKVVCPIMYNLYTDVMYMD